MCVCVCVMFPDPRPRLIGSSTSPSSVSAARTHRSGESGATKETRKERQEGRKSRCGEEMRAGKTCITCRRGKTSSGRDAEWRDGMGWAQEEQRENERERERGTASACVGFKTRPMGPTVLVDDKWRRHLTASPHACGHRRHKCVLRSPCRPCSWQQSFPPSRDLAHTKLTNACVRACKRARALCPPR